jgi:hypothetical protein
MFVPVINADGKPLMPTKPSRAKRLLKSGRAYSFWSRGTFCIRMKEVLKGKIQPIAVGVDSGSKREAYTIKSEHHTYLNVLSDAITWVKEAVEVRRNARRTRRFRKTPYRKARYNRKFGGITPSVKARWQLKLNVCKWLCKLYPIEAFIVEDIKAATLKGKKGKWNSIFSPLQIGKNWFYIRLALLGKIETKQGYETADIRTKYNLKKTNKKLSIVFSAHNIDSWVLANWYTGGHIKPDNEDLKIISPIRLHRRQLHYFQPSVKGARRRYGGTRSLGLKRGSIVYNIKYGLTYVGGNLKGKLSLHNIGDGKRLCQNANIEETTFVCFNPWKFRNVTVKKR